MESKRYIASLDSGTSSTRVILFDEDGKPVPVENPAPDSPKWVSCQEKYETLSPYPEWSELKPEKILSAAKNCIDGCLELAGQQGINSSQVKGLGIAVQRESIVIWNKNTGEAMRNAILWNDNRTSSLCKKYLNTDMKDKVKQKSGLRIANYFSALKIRWVMDNCPEIKDAIENGTAMIGTVDSWLVYKLGEKKHLTDISNAGRTALLSLETGDWDQELLDGFGIPREALPKVLPSAADFGKLVCTALEGTPIASVLGDQQAALLGQRCFKEGDAKTTYGTGAFFLVNVGKRPHPSENLLTCPAWEIQGERLFAMEGSIAAAGVAIEWLIKHEMIGKASEVSDYAEKVEDTDGLYFVPVFSGHLAPLWRPDVCPVILGWHFATEKTHLARAILEAIAFQVNSVVKEAEKDFQPVKTHYVDGGVSQSNVMMNIQADILGTSVHRPHFVETTALGAAIAAGIQVGIFESLADYDRRATSITEYSVFDSSMAAEERRRKIVLWDAAVQRSLGWPPSE